MAKRNREAQAAREFSPADLNKEIHESYRKLFQLRLQRTTRQLTNPNEIRLTRRQIARLLTMRRERAFADGQEEG